jgi:hypothetical protein
MSRGNGFDLGGGRTLWAGLGIGARWLRTRNDYTIDVKAFPPLAPGVFGPSTPSVTSDEVQRTDNAIDVMATYTVPIAWPAVRVRVSGGPTFFSVEQAMVRSLSVSTTITPPTAMITDIEDADAHGHGWGFNVGADVTYFFSRHVGLGGGVRFGKGTADVEFPTLDEKGFQQTAELDAGQLTWALGMRFQF